MKTAAIAGTSRGDARAMASVAEMTAADAAMIHHEAENLQQPDV
jgi:hypothetical protein